MGEPGPRTMLDGAFCRENGHPVADRTAIVERVQSVVFVVCLRCGHMEEAGHNA